MPSFTSKSKTVKLSDDSASTHSTVSTATTLKGAESPKKKFFSRDSTSTPASNTPGEKNAKRALHYEAVASYLSMR
ncbi:hypothetical protein N7492_000746 [Penicillium capsulatum]|uniref:Uncharacterized protein n=1 Tax=Penicillium capsulatum TaxID=69766 RepID=A0A9W9LZ92_9EURO|nr:hypothetical protein N7492_000746 [Penicillium capsulatum]KAJ6130195.1 hypothetical protein N7512_002975 [Penicillium capsulatum]